MSRGGQRSQEQLGCVGGDERVVRIPLHNPFVPGAAFVPGEVSAAVVFVVHVPDGVPGVGQCIPLDTDQRRLWRAQACAARCLGATDAGDAIAEKGGDRGRAFRIRDQARLHHRRAVANGTGGHVLELVTDRGPAAGAEASAHVLAHAGEAFLAADDRVPAIDAAHGVEQQDVGGRAGGRQLRVVDGDALLARLAVDPSLFELVAGDARGVEREEYFPAAIAALQSGLERDEARPAVVLARHYDVAEFGDERQVKRRRQLR
ncbi:MAG TPA: hypothetical protein VJT81_06810 [Burkholderiales bacterium]|nr:hypothetical protein [Burkholderiales bacterium]